MVPGRTETGRIILCVDDVIVAIEQHGPGLFRRLGRREFGEQHWIYTFLLSGRKKGGGGSKGIATFA